MSQISAHVPEPRPDREASDQRQFDDAVEHKGKVVLEWLAGAGILAAVLMSAIALIQSGERREGGGQAVTQAAASASASANVSSAPPLKPLSFKVIPSSKQGPDGKKHDAFTQTEFTVHVGQPLKLVIDNTDESPHSITSPDIGVNITIQPGIHTYELTVKEAGRFQWFCIIPCDTEAGGWAMQHAGFMSGYITAT